MLEIRCLDHYNSVIDWIAKQPTDHTKAKPLREKFKAAMKYLSEYANRPGCTYEQFDEHGHATGKNTKAVLHKDHAPLSFGFDMMRTEDNGETWTHWFSGGVIYNGPDSLTVSLESSSQPDWGIHT